MQNAKFKMQEKTLPLASTLAFWLLNFELRRRRSHAGVSIAVALTMTVASTLIVKADADATVRDAEKSNVGRAASGSDRTAAR
jgi:hypothetical protein